MVQKKKSTAQKCLLEVRDESGLQMIFHILPKKDWEAALAAGEYAAASLASEGFIHCSTSEQVVDTANRFYRGVNGLLLLCIDEEKVNAEVRYETAADIAQQFPHIYGPLNLKAVVSLFEFSPNTAGMFILPQGFDEV